MVSSIIDRTIRHSLGTMRSDKVSRQDVERLHSSLCATPVAAKRALAVLRALYSWAGRHGFVAEGFNPARDIEKFPEKFRERFLTTDEFARLGDALDDVDIEPNAAAAIRLSGARLREIFECRWEFVDFDRAVIFLPESKTGRKPIYLSKAALSIIQNLPAKAISLSKEKVEMPAPT